MDLFSAGGFLMDRPFWAVLTALVSFSGFIVAALIGFELKGSNSETKSRMSTIYFGDAMMFLVVFLFAVASFIHVIGNDATVMYAIGRVIRLWALVFLVWALWRFYVHVMRLKEISDEDENDKG